VNWVVWTPRFGFAGLDFPGESASVIIEDLPPGTTLSVEGWNAR
jgi:hypothetical protein